MEMLRILLEGTEKNTLIGKCQIVALSFLLTANFESRDQFTECHGMLVVHVLYAINVRMEEQILGLVERSISTEKSDVMQQRSNFQWAYIPVGMSFHCLKPHRLKPRNFEPLNLLSIAELICTQINFVSSCSIVFGPVTLGNTDFLILKSSPIAGSKYPRFYMCPVFYSYCRPVRHYFYGLYFAHTRKESLSSHQGPTFAGFRTNSIGITF
jgi:hypothetical protein